MIFVGLGSNLPAEPHNSSKETLIAAVDSFIDWGIDVNRISSWYKSAPVPISDQPWYVNAVAEVKTSLSPHDLIKTLLKIEKIFGRHRVTKNGARTLDLDLLTYYKVIIDGTVKNGITAFIPHPRMIKRKFVLMPIRELYPNWIHPYSGCGIQDLIKCLPKDQITTLL